MIQSFGPYIDGYWNKASGEFEISIKQTLCTAAEADEVAANLRAAVLWAREKTRRAQDEQTPSLF